MNGKMALSPICSDFLGAGPNFDTSAACDSSFTSSREMGLNVRSHG